VLRGGLAGKGARGGKGAVDAAAVEGYDWNSFRRSNTYVWGYSDGVSVTEATITPGAAVGGPSFLRAYPHVFPRSGTIDRIGWFQGEAWLAANGGSSLTLGIYDANQSTLVPGALLWQSTAFTAWPSPILLPAQHWQYQSPALRVRGPRVLFLAWFYNAAFGTNAQTMQGIDIGANIVGAGIMGCLSPTEGPQEGGNYRRPTGNTAKFIGWRVSQAFGTMPSTFPTVGVRRNTATFTTVSGEINTFNNRVPTFAFDWTPAA
jgi:hypothetical protein